MATADKNKSAADPRTVQLEACHLGERRDPRQSMVFILDTLVVEVILGIAGQSGFKLI